MAYSDVPFTIDETLSVSQPKIKQNFLDINTVISVDHETFGAANGQGKHKWVKLTEQVDQATLVNEMALYIKDNVTEPNLYLRKKTVEQYLT